VAELEIPITVDPALVLRALGRSTPDLIYVLDRNARYTFVSEQGARILGFTPEEMVGRTWADLGLPQERLHEFEEDRARILKAGTAARREVTFPTPTGDRTFEYTITPLLRDGGEPEGFVYVSRDITARVAADRLLREQLRFRRAIEQSAAAGLLTIDTEGRITSANRAFAQMSGWSEDELLSMQPPFAFWSPEETGRLQRVLAKALKGHGLPEAIETVFQRKDGSRFPVTVQTSPLLADDGSIIGWLAIVNDTTVIAASERRYRDLADAMPQIVFAARPDGRIDYFNQRWMDYVGNETSWDSVVHPDDRQEAGEAWHHAMLTGEPFQFEGRLRSRSGDFRWHLGRAIPVRDDAGNIVRWYGTATDIEDLKRHNAMLQTLLDVSNVLSAELDVGKVIQSVTDAATQLAGAEFGSFFYNVTDESGQSYVLYALSGAPREAFEGFPMPRNTELFAPTFNGTAIVRSDDIRKDPRYGRNAPYHGMPQGHLPVVSYLAVPVISKSGLVIGGLFFGHAKPGVFTEDSERLVVGVAAQAAIAIDNARLMEETRRAAERIQREEERYRTLVNATAQVVWSASPAGEPLEQQPAWRDLTGRDAAPMRDGRWLEVMHPQDRERAAAAWQQAIATSTTYAVEVRIRRMDGSYRWFAFRGVPLHESDGTIREWIGTATDIDRRKRGEEAASFLTDASALLASSLDPETIVTRLAQLAVPRIADWAAVDVVQDGAPYRRLVIAHPDPEKARMVAEIDRQYRLPPDVDPVAGVLASRKPLLVPHLAPDYIDALAQDERHRQIIHSLGLTSLIIVPIVAGGSLYGALTLVQAESGRRFTERDLQLAGDVAARAGVAVYNAQLYVEAQAASHAKDEFLATLSHELRTPMTSILGWAAMLKMGEVDAALLDEAITAIDRSSRAQAQLIDDLLDVSRITLGKLHLTIEDVSIDEIVASASEAVRPAANAKKVALDVMLDPQKPRINGDPNRLQQVIWNLLSNAVKFTPSGGSVRVTVSSDAAVARVVVSDTGEGIDRDFLPHMFARFRQADSTTTRRFGGLGLGLSIVKQITELHGGTVVAESEGRGRGATFTVTLPLRGERVREHAAAAPQLPDLRGIDVLVVDDDESARRMMQAVLARAGASVRVAASVGEALREIRRAPPRVLVSDIAMPGRDGYSLIRDLRHVLHIGEDRLPAIAITAFGRNEDRVAALAAGYQRYVMKPVAPQDLARCVADLAK
jgi:PAS domain S-box-containing protein